MKNCWLNGFGAAALMVFLLMATYTHSQEEGIANGRTDNLPVIVPDFPQRDGVIRNPVSWDMLNHISTRPAYMDGLWINVMASRMQGVAYTGQYPFEAGESDYAYTSFRSPMPIAAGQGGLAVEKYLRTKTNANEWPQGQCEPIADCPTPTINYRLHLLESGSGKIRDWGFYDSRIAFIRNDDGSFSPALSIVEGPFAASVDSRKADRATITFETNGKCLGSVHLVENGQVYAGIARSTRHVIELTGLAPGANYQYQAKCQNEGNSVKSGTYPLQTAPQKGDGKKVIFAFGSDSREGEGGGERRYMGHNRHVLSRVAQDAYRRGAHFFLFGGDLINGYTSNRDDFHLQLKGWKQTMAGFWRSRPVYPAMGNHEALLNVFDDGSKYGIALDQWPYATHSAEAVFAEAFWNPKNGPQPVDNRRPAYMENVYWFQYGPVACVAFNNNYWWTTNEMCPTYGGSPEGYMLDDQLQWIEKTLNDLESDDTVKTIFLYAQEPVFPAGGHPQDAMWWLGDNRVRAYDKGPDGRIAAAGPGIIDVRNRFWTAVAGNHKVAAVLTGDEHAYHRIRIDSHTPVGMMQDDTDGDGQLACTPSHAENGNPPERCSPNPDFKFPTWQITAGNAGAPWYNKQAEKIPWSKNIVFFSSQSGYALFEVVEEKVTMMVYAVTGQLLDRVDNLMAIKNED
jgi:hypothetical protein